MARRENLTFHVLKTRPAPAPTLRLRGSRNRQAAIEPRSRSWGGVLIALLVFVGLPLFFYWLLRS